MMNGIARVSLGLVLLSAIAACSSDDSDSSGGGYSMPARSTACKSWQKAECDWLVDTCNTPMLDRATCDEQFGAMFCKADATMQSCTTALPNATCGTTPAECNGVADPAPAVAYCNAFVSAACKRSTECGSSVPNCTTTMSTQLGCASAVGVKATGQQCLSDIATVACDAEGLPASCKGVLLTATSTASLKIELPGLSSSIDLRPALQQYRH